MRVISGTFKGRKLIPPKGLTIRPTPDKVKGAIFNILGDRIIELSFLDLFAGTGAIGIEALSRGAKEIIFVDDNIKAINLIKENLSRCKMQDARCKIVKENAVEFIKSVGRVFAPAKFFFIFFAPPYKSDLGEKALIEISSFNILKEDGEIIWEHYYKKITNYEFKITNLKLKRTICYGDTALSFFSYH